MSDRKVFRKLISLEEAIRIIRDKIKPSRKVRLNIEESIDMISAENVFSTIDVPAYTRSEVDGYALRSADVCRASESCPAELKLIGRIGPDEIFEGNVKEGECVEVSTGSPLPFGADSIVPLEFSEEKNERVRIYRRVNLFENVLKAGIDFKFGDLVLGEGERISEAKIAALASIGRRTVAVYDRLRIGIISTGDELVSPGKELRIGRIFDVNSYLIASHARKAGFKVEILGIVRDNYDELLKAVKSALEKIDVLIISGGSSVGTRDLVYRIFRRMGSELEFHGVLMRPGKPTGFGLINGKPVLCLPGNPVSSIISFINIFLRPLIGEKAPKKIKAELLRKFFVAKGRREFVPTVLIKKGDKYLAYPIPGSSGAISRIHDADGAFSIPPGHELIEEGCELQVDMLFDEGPSDLLILGEIDPVIRYAAYLIWRRVGIKVRTIRVGREEALSEARKLGSMVALKSMNKVGLEDWIEVFSYGKVFGLYLSENAWRGINREKMIRVGSWPPWTMEFKLQRKVTRRLKLDYSGYITSSMEGLRYVDGGYLDGAFMYKIRDKRFVETGEIKVHLLAPKWENRDLFQKIEGLLKKERFDELKKRLLFLTGLNEP